MINIKRNLEPIGREIAAHCIRNKINMIARVVLDIAPCSACDAITCRDARVEYHSHLHRAGSVMLCNVCGMYLVTAASDEISKYKEHSLYCAMITCELLGPDIATHVIPNLLWFPRLVTI